jgi:hypothetical protein
MRGMADATGRHVLGNVSPRFRFTTARGIVVREGIG